MCGIAGFTIAPGDRGRIKTASMLASLAIDMQARGTDATGVFTVDFKGRTKLRKDEGRADVFLAARSGIGANAQSALIHTRQSTKGRPHIMANNHPIKHGSIVGIHNGVIYNDDALFKEFGWSRNGEVDSEAIFAALNHLDLDKALENIDGSWAIAWSDVESTSPGRLWLARGSSSPMHYALTEEGSIVFASTRLAVVEAFEYGGISGKPQVIEAKEGFLACTDPDQGGITVLPPFDGSGKNAIGVRKYKTSISTGEDWEYAAARFHTTYGYQATPTAPVNPYRPPAATKPTADPAPADPRPYERVQLTGTKGAPKVGDRRKYLTEGGQWVQEACTKVEEGLVVWQMLIDPSTPHERLGVHEYQERRFGSAIQTPPVEVEPALPFDEPEETAADVLNRIERRRFIDDTGYAQVGDTIFIDKVMFDGGTGSLVGKVVGYDETNRELVVEWRPSRLHIEAVYDVAGVTTY